MKVRKRLLRPHQKKIRTNFTPKSLVTPKKMEVRAYMGGGGEFPKASLGIFQNRDSRASGPRPGPFVISKPWGSRVRV